MWFLYPGRIGIWRCWLLRRKENRRTGEKRSEQGENQQQTQPTHDTGPESTRAILMEGGRSHHCAIPALHKHIYLTEIDHNGKRGFR